MLTGFIKMGRASYAVTSDREDGRKATKKKSVSTTGSIIEQTQKKETRTLGHGMQLIRKDAQIGR